jgi:nucleotidyltransferase substrate binding protein (TIGR01987 family)
MNIDISYYERCISTLERAYELLLKADPLHIEYDMYRSASIKEFEIILEQSGKLLRRLLKPYFPSPKVLDQLYFKDIFRHAVQHGILTPDTCTRWLNYRDNRNNTAHDYGVHFAQETLLLLPLFISDAKQLAQIIQQNNTHAP